jgi:hypothetical protein
MNTTLTRILLATYGSEDTDFAAHTAIRLANSADCELHLVYVERLPRYPAQGINGQCLRLGYPPRPLPGRCGAFAGNR